MRISYVLSSSFRVDPNGMGIAELQGQSSAAVIGEMRDSLIDSWA